MRFPARLAALALPAALLVLTGCSHRPNVYYATPPPPPPAWASQALVQTANGNGFRDGRSDGERDFLSGYGFHARADEKFRVTPGYQERFGPYDAYRDMYREAYERGYDNGFQHARMTGR